MVIEWTRRDKRTDSKSKSKTEQNIMEGNGDPVRPSREEVGEVTHETVDVCPSALWSSFPSFLESNLGYGWSDGTDMGAVAERGLNAVLVPRKKEESAKTNSTPDNFIAIDADEDNCTHVATSFTSSSAVGRTDMSPNIDSVEPIVHVFSHQRHTMHVSIHDVFMHHLAESPSSTSHASSNIREGKWMTSEEIVEAGITSGCKKVLKAVLAARNVGAKGKIKKDVASATKTPVSEKKRRAGGCWSYKGRGVGGRQWKKTITHLIVLSPLHQECV